MKAIRALLVGGLVAMTAPHTHAQATTPALRAALPSFVSTVHQAAASEARAFEQTARTAHEKARAEFVAASKEVRLAAPVIVKQGRREVRLPELCRNRDGRYDVLVHFHGVPDKIAAAYEKSGVNAVLVTINLGIGSGPYETMFTRDGALSDLLGSVDELVQKHCPSKTTEKTGFNRVALSGWSAGYGAIYRVLMTKNDSQLVDSVLLADGLHAGFMDKYRQQINALQMQPFDEFAAKAARGEKLFAITHTQIQTPYASTSETSSYLIEKRGLSRTKVNEQGPLASMTLTSRVDQGSFHVRGYAGGDTHAHCDHLNSIGDTLFSTLSQHWSR